ncbi:unnamed protein product, partial [Mesorhabditis belari]|uniref:N-acyl-aliphatic-L-amino acid amidohydrolase n=1 Tax=Mesorhabditis belari TaxID=2138241 RepID=A0AAF3EDA6_9BILA
MSDEDIAVTKFREYLRIRTDQPEPDYESCVKFLFALADELGIERVRVEPVTGYPFVVMTIPGKAPQLSAIVLHSHTDVVPVYREKWTHDPFSGDKDEKGNIYGRGAQDMKSNGIQYFEAIRRHFSRGIKEFKRNVHIIWGPDEERGSRNGMEKFLESQEFQKLNIGFVLDEGMASEDQIYRVYYAERCKWWIRVSFTGRPGHGSRIIDNSAAEKMLSFLNSALKFRESQKVLLESDPTKTLGDVTTLNLTMIKGGVETNVVPADFECEFDIRVPPTVDFDALEKEINEWAQKAGKGTKIEFILHKTFKNMTPHMAGDPFWEAFENVLKKERCTFRNEIFPAGTDSGLIREKGYRSIGFSPIINTQCLLHDHDEFLNERVYLRGVEIYEKLIEALANIDEEK